MDSETADLPSLGLGTWKQSDFEQCAESVATALDLGYRHVDTAQIYGNESAVGAGIERSSVPEDDIFLATKVWKEHLAYDQVIATVEESLDRLGVDEIDLLYAHWPSGTYDPSDTLAAFETLYDRGAIRGVGLSNFTPRLIETALDECTAPIRAVQVEMHPALQQDALRSFLRERNLPLVAYCPLAHGRVFEMPELASIAEQYDVSEAVISLAWLLSKPGVHPIPKATSEAHLRENLKALELELDPEDRRRIDRMERQSRILDPDHAPDWNRAEAPEG